MNYFSGLMLLAAVTGLTGCISRADADKRLERGCAAGAELFMTDGFKIKDIKQSTFADSAELGEDYRVINMNVVESDGWADVDKAIQCIFSENLGFGGHTATIYQLKMDDKIWGKQGDEVLGSFEDHLKLTETVEQGMNRK